MYLTFEKNIYKYFFRRNEYLKKYIVLPINTSNLNIYRMRLYLKLFIFYFLKITRSLLGIFLTAVKR